MAQSSVNRTPILSPKLLALQGVQSTTPSHLFLFLEIFSQEGGIQSYVQDILRAYGQIDSSQSCDIFLLRDRPYHDHPLLNTDLSFHYFFSKITLLGRLHFAIALFLYLLRRRPRHVFCGHILLAPLVQRMCRLFQVPYTVLTYGKEVWMPLSSPYQCALTHASSIWTISRYTGDRLCAANNISSDKLQFLPCAIDGEHFTPGPKSTELQQRYGLAPTDKVLVTVARLWSGDIYKGVDVTLRALPTIQQTIPNVKYLIIGRGDDQPRLAQLARDLEVEEHVIFAGFVPTEELRDHYRLASIYVMPSQEGFGIVYLEAMACGIPVISGDADGSADPLQEGQVGWRVPHRDSHAVAHACINVLQGQDKRCDGVWLRQEAIATFGKPAFQQTLQSLLAII